MSKTIVIKSVILSIAFLINVLMPATRGAMQGFLLTFFFPFIFGVIIIPLIIKFNAILFKLKIEKPNWRDNPLTLKRPLSFFHFMAYFILIPGLGMTIGTALKFHELNSIALSAIGYGAGILVGIQLTLIWIKDKTDVVK